MATGPAPIGITELTDDTFLGAPTYSTTPVNTVPPRSITEALDDSFYTGGNYASSSPSSYPVAIAGRNFMLDTDDQDLRLAGLTFRFRSIDLIRQQADSSAVPSEASINPEGLWRRATESWHGGAGQTYFDRPESNPYRFRASKGIDVFSNKYEAKLLPATELIYASGDDNVEGLVVDNYYYMVNGDRLFFTSDLTIPTTDSAIQATETPAALYGITTDGHVVYAAMGADGIHTTVVGSTTADHYSDVPASVVGYVKGRLMAGYQNDLYNVTVAGAVDSGDLLLTHSNTDFTWVDFAEGPTHIYAAGRSSSKSLIYKITIKADGTALDAPVATCTLPNGEIVESINGYLSTLEIGTSAGLRYADIDSNGDINLGDLIPTPNSVLCFESQGSSVYYGLSNYDDNSTGIGQLNFRDPFPTDGLRAPAYASSLMADNQGAVTSISTFGSARVFSVVGQGYYKEADYLVSEGTLESGLISYRLPDQKVALFVDVRHAADFEGSHAIDLATDDGEFTAVALYTSRAGGSRKAIGQHVGEVFEIRDTLNSGADRTEGPIVRRHTLYANPSVNSGAEVILPLLLSDVDYLDDTDYSRDIDSDFAFIRLLQQSGLMTSFRIGDNLYTGIVQSYDWRGHHLNTDGSNYNATCPVTLKTIN